MQERSTTSPINAHVISMCSTNSNKLPKFEIAISPRSPRANISFQSNAKSTGSENVINIKRFHIVRIQKSKVASNDVIFPSFDLLNIDQLSFNNNENRDDRDSKDLKNMPDLLDLFPEIPRKKRFSVRIEPIKQNQHAHSDDLIIFD